MNPRERLLAVAVLGTVILAGGAFLFYQLFYVPFRDRSASLARLVEEGERKQAQIDKIQADRPKLVRWRHLSLPSDADVAKREYEKYLSELVRKSGFEDVGVAMRNTDSRSTLTLPGKGPVYTGLTYTVQGRASLASLVAMLEGFYRTGLMHQIKNLTIQRPQTLRQQQRKDDLDINMTVEALIVGGAESRKHLLPLDRRLLSATLSNVTAPASGPGGLAVALWVASPTGPMGPGDLPVPPRRYEAIAAKNIFFGPPVAPAEQPTEPERELTKFAFLTDITRNDKRVEASLYDRYTNRQTRLRVEPGFDRFSLLESGQGNTVIHGVVKRIEHRSLVFQVQLAASAPDDSPTRRYRDPEIIYRLHRADLETLVQGGVVRTEEGERLYQVDRDYWESLVRDKVVRLEGSDFVFRWELIRGTVIRSDNRQVILRLDDKYCSYRGEDGDRPKPHGGYCTLGIGRNLAHALQAPLAEKEVQELTAAGR